MHGKRKTSILHLHARNAGEADIKTGADGTFPISRNEWRVAQKRQLRVSNWERTEIFFAFGWRSAFGAAIEWEE